MKKLQLNSTQLKLQNKSTEQSKFKNVFASRKSHTKTYAIKKELFLNSDQVSSYENKEFEVEVNGILKTVRIDWESAVLGKYNTSIEFWKSNKFKSQVKTDRNLKEMSTDEWNAYNREMSRKSKFKKQLKVVGLELTDFCEQVEIKESEFFTDKFLSDYKSKNETSNRKSDCSPYQLDSWL